MTSNTNMSIFKFVSTSLLHYFAPNNLVFKFLVVEVEPEAELDTPFPKEIELEPSGFKALLEISESWMVICITCIRLS
jgi:hypothetical protein